MPTVTTRMQYYFDHLPPRSSSAVCSPPAGDDQRGPGRVALTEAQLVCHHLSTAIQGSIEITNQVYRSCTQCSPPPPRRLSARTRERSLPPEHFRGTTGGICSTWPTLCRRLSVLHTPLRMGPLPARHRASRSPKLIRLPALSDHVCNSHISRVLRRQTPRHNESCEEGTRVSRPSGQRPPETHL